MKGQKELFYGLLGIGAWALFRGGAEDEIIRILFFDISAGTISTIALIFGIFNLVIGLFSNDGFADLIGEILALPFRLLGWGLEHWYLVLMAVLAFNWYQGQNTAEAAEPPAAAAQTEFSLLEKWETTREEAAEETYCIPPATAAVFDDDRSKNPFYQRNAGLCQNLTQDAEVLLVFVNDNESSWTQKEIQRFTANLVDPGLDFIEYRANEYGYRISLEHCFFTDDSGNALPMQYPGTVYDADSGNYTRDLVTCAVSAYNYASWQDMVQSVRDYGGSDQVAIIFCLDKDGRSFARSSRTDGDVVEHAVIFTSWQYPSRPSVVAHEVMHLFGAEDLYSAWGDRNNREAMVKQLHPKELFYDGQWNLYDNEICPYTAYTVGWLSEIPAQYDCAAWWS